MVVGRWSLAGVAKVGRLWLVVGITHFWGYGEDKRERVPNNLCMVQITSLIAVAKVGDWQLLVGKK